MKKLLIIFLLQINFLHGLEIKCNFEEVYGNGEVQQGIFFLKNQKLRYEYLNKNLFTIIAKNENFFLVNQAHKNNVSKISYTRNGFFCAWFIVYCHFHLALTSPTIGSSNTACTISTEPS